MTGRKHPGAHGGASGAGMPFRRATEGTRTLSPQSDNAKPIASLRVRRLRALGITDDARNLMDDFRKAVRGWEAEAEGLMLSFIGKLPGLAARLALVLGYIDFAGEGAGEPQAIDVSEFGRAAHLVEAYFLPMARRAYADAATPKAERAARRLVGIIRENGWQSFASRDVLRLDRAGLGSAAELNPALAALEDGDCIRAIEPPANATSGRPQRLFSVNPAIHGGLT